MIPYVYIVVRNDLEKEHQLVQATHAALEAGYDFERPDITTHMVVLHAQNEEHLEEIAMYLQEEKVEYRMFHEGWGNIGHTALATKPIQKVKKGLLRILPLLKF